MEIRVFGNYLDPADIFDWGTVHGVLVGCIAPAIDLDIQADSTHRQVWQVGRTSYLLRKYQILSIDFEGVVLEIVLGGYTNVHLRTLGSVLRRLGDSGDIEGSWTCLLMYTLYKALKW